MSVKFKFTFRRFSRSAWEVPDGAGRGRRALREGKSRLVSAEGRESRTWERVHPGLPGSNLLGGNRQVTSRGLTALICEMEGGDLL